MNREIFLDNNATTMPLPAVRSAIFAVLGEAFGNASSANSAGSRARRHISEARVSVARLVGADDSNIIFTSGGTESNNIAILSAVPAHKTPARIVTTSTEHSSILKLVDHLVGQGIEVVVLPVDTSGRIDLDLAAREITSRTSLVSVQWANNETGVIQPVEQLAKICQERGVPFHTDAAQVIGKMRIDVSKIPIDLLTMTAHKIHGPQGVGAIYARNTGWLSPILFGGPQEHGLRGGTENLPGIVGFGAAAQLRFHSLDSVVAKLTRLRDIFERRVQAAVSDVAVNGDASNRTCNTTNLRFHCVDGQALVANLDAQGIQCSQSSACTNQRPEPSYVLRAMGLSEDEAYSCIRFSFGVCNHEDELNPTVQAIANSCSRLRDFAARIHNPYLTART